MNTRCFGGRQPRPALLPHRESDQPGEFADLLRRCHLHIHRRTFDPSRIPEYINRILLGFLAGGIIILFLTPESKLIGGVTPITEAALAFLAGSSSDFLYTALERISNAVLPKRPAEADQG